MAAPNVRAEILSQDPSSMWPGLAKAVLDYSSGHEAHDLYAYESEGDYPWWPDEPEWFIWREVQGPFFKPPFRESDIDLPLNVIHDLGIRTWTDALVHYKATCPCVSNPEALEGFFNEMLRKA